MLHYFYTHTDIIDYINFFREHERVLARERAAIRTHADMSMHLRCWNNQQ